MAANATFAAISASWTVPEATGNGYSTSADATWIGIGGVTTSDLIQVGTDNTVSASGQVTTSAFYELLPAPAQTIPTVTVAAGDSMSASLTETSAGEWTVTITDETNGQSFTDNVAYDSSNSSAEWIEEDPSETNDRLIPLDNFGTVNFSAGSAVANGSNVSITGSDAQKIILVNRAGEDVATPSSVSADGASFSVTQSSGG